MRMAMGFKHGLESTRKYKYQILVAKYSGFFCEPLFSFMFELKMGDK
jgi:hypothetical protein